MESGGGLLRKTAMDDAAMALPRWFWWMGQIWRGGRILVFEFFLSWA